MGRCIIRLDGWAGKLWEDCHEIAVLTTAELSPDYEDEGLVWSTGALAFQYERAATGMEVTPKFWVTISRVRETATGERVLDVHVLCGTHKSETAEQIVDWLFGPLLASDMATITDLRQTLRDDAEPDIPSTEDTPKRGRGIELDLDVPVTARQPAAASQPAAIRPAESRAITPGPARQLWRLWTPEPQDYERHGDSGNIGGWIPRGSQTRRAASLIDSVVEAELDVASVPADLLGVIGPIGRPGPVGPVGTPGVLGPAAPQGADGVEGADGPNGSRGQSWATAVSPAGAEELDGHQYDDVPPRPGDLGW